MKRPAAFLPWILALGCASPPPVDPKREATAQAACETGNRASEKKDFSKAIEHYSQALALSPAYPQAYLGRARAREELGQAGEAEVDFNRAVETASEEKKAIYFYHRGRFFQRQRKPAPAVEDFNRASELFGKWPEPDYPLAVFLHRGLALLNLDRPEEAIRDFEIVLESNPDPETRRQIVAEIAKAKAILNRNKKK